MTDATTRYPRALRRTLRDDISLYPVVAVMGARQVGKSTLCQELARQLGFAHRTLDDQDVRRAAQADPAGFLAELGDRGALIDEVQRAPDLMLAIKAVVDREQRAGRYLLTGSNQPGVGRAVGDSLLGRAAYRTLRPLTLSELRFDEEHAGWSFLFTDHDNDVLDELNRRASASGQLNWRDVVTTGGFPRALAAPREQALRILNDYVTVFAARDARELIAVDSPGRLEEFVRLAAAWTGQVLNLSGIATDLGIPTTTARRWLEVLQRSFLIELVPAYSRNASQRVIKAPRLYAVDPALAVAAARETAPTGFHLETLVANDLLVWRDGAPTRAVFHWRLSSGQEVDFVLEEDTALVPVEVKASQSVGLTEARHLRTFRERHANATRALLLSGDPQIRVLADGIIAAPWWSVL